MPAATTRLALPYPVADDTVDVPRDVRALADKLDPIVATIPVVTTLPASPYDGQVVAYAADAANGVLWQLRYRAAASGSYKWEFVGGTPLISPWVGAHVDATGGVWQTTDCNVVVPLAGQYYARTMAEATAPANAAYIWSTQLAISDVAIALTGGSVAGPNAGAVSTAHCIVIASPPFALAAGTRVDMQVKVEGVGGTFTRRQIELTPVRVAP
jgi:hypothetical protein